MTFAHGDVLPAQWVWNISFKTVHGYPQLVSRGLGYAYWRTTQVVVTETSKSEIQDPQDAKPNTVLSWTSGKQRFVHLAPKSIASTSTKSHPRTPKIRSVTQINCSSLHWMSTWKIWSTIIPFLMVRKLHGYVKRFTWISKAQSIWCPSENICTS